MSGRMKMELALPPFDYRVKKQKETVWIFDVLRRKYVVLTPEEWVRQHVIHYLLEHKGYPPSLVAVEREIDVYGLRLRFDLVVFDRKAQPWLIIECKAPSVALSQKVFDQVFRYNISLTAPYVAVTNGIVHYCGKWEAGHDFHFIDDFPLYEK